jgi:nicotinamidase-related amidase
VNAVKSRVQDSTLILVDVQEKLVPPLWQKRRFLLHLECLLRACRVLEVPILVTEQYPKGLGSTLEHLKGLIDPEAPVIEKVHFSAWGTKSFRESLLGSSSRRQVILSGIESHICVLQTARDLVGAGFDVHLPVDAVTSRHASDYRVGCDQAKECGAWLTTVETLLFGWLQRGDDPRFRPIQEFIKSKDRQLMDADESLNESALL